MEKLTATRDITCRICRRTIKKGELALFSLQKGVRCPSHGTSTALQPSKLKKQKGRPLRRRPKPIQEKPEAKPLDSDSAAWLAEARAKRAG